ncbi:MAG: S8 family serine peptidase [Acidobacteria bacterium]|nr:S8 family serine peptidase [Acidobacteriota bacterium]
MAARRLEFEALAAAREVIDGYDSASDQWTLSFESPFWHAVTHAQSLGRRGAGRRIALIDSGCDLTIPRLRRVVDRLTSFVPDPADHDELGHGTAVALLISEVAPECRLDVYQVARNGTPDDAAVVAALRAAGASSADVVSVSLAARSPFQFTRDQLQEAIAAGDGSGKRYAFEHPPCAVCAAAMDVAGRGKMIVAAAGNALDSACCPARADGVVAAGFEGRDARTTTLEDGGKQEVAFAAAPAVAQSLLTDMSLAEIPGVLGTSFAAPLIAGAAAIVLSPAELSAYVASQALAAMPQFLHALIKTSRADVPAESVRQIGEWYMRAQQRLPHVHCDYQARLNPAVACTDPAQCASCGIFAESIMVNHGLWLLETGRLEWGKSLLEAARLVAPWSADATANLGAIARELGDITGAIELYERALELRPGFRVYTSELKRLRNRLPAAGRWWSRFWS